MVNEWADPKRDFSGVDWKSMYDQARADLVRWRRAHEIVEGERDQARERLREVETVLAKCMSDYQDVEDERDDADQRCAVAESERDRWKLHHDRVDGQWAKAEREVARLRDMERERDEWRARAEAAEARTAVTREDVEKVVHGSGGGFFDSRLDAITDAVCDLLGIEAGQATDPLLDKAQEFAALADWELTDREAGLLHTVARHVLGQEAKR